MDLTDDFCATTGGWLEATQVHKKPSDKLTRGLEHSHRRRP